MKESGSADATADREIRKALYLESISSSGRTSPNPTVACVAAGPGGFFFSGGTEPPGGRHAEIVALDQLDDRLNERPEGRADRAPSRPFDLFVTLEPCSRQGRTPPCTLRIARYGPGSDFERRTGRYLRNILIGHPDPSLSHEGRHQLEGMGFTVWDLAGATLFRPFLSPFFHGLNARRPLYLIKVATDATGLMGIRGRSLGITGPAGRILTMRLRARCDAVLVGAGTTAVDLPSLDLRPPLSVGPPRPGGSEECFDRSSYDWLEEDEMRHPLAWFRGLFEPDGGWDLLERDGNLRKQYQPTRIFLLGRPFAGREAFFERQADLSDRTGRETIYLAHQSHATHWRGVPAIPDLDDPAFFEILGEELIARGLQRILVESGKGMLGKWVAGMGPEDHLVHVHSEAVVKLPAAENPAESLRLSEELSPLKRLDRVAFAPGLTADLYGRDQER